MVIAKKVIKALPVIKTPETQAVTFHLNVYKRFLLWLYDLYFTKGCTLINIIDVFKYEEASFIYPFDFYYDQVSERKIYQTFRNVNPCVKW